MATPNYNLPTIVGTDTIDLVNAINGLANATDTALHGVASEGIVPGANTVATAALQDGSVTLQKLAADLQQKIGNVAPPQVLWQGNVSIVGGVVTAGTAKVYVVLNKTANQVYISANFNESVGGAGIVTNAAGDNAGKVPYTLPSEYRPNSHLQPSMNVFLPNYSLVLVTSLSIDTDGAIWVRASCTGACPGASLFGNASFMYGI